MRRRVGRGDRGRRSHGGAGRRGRIGKGDVPAPRALRDAATDAGAGVRGSCPDRQTRGNARAFG